MRKILITKKSRPQLTSFLNLQEVKDYADSMGRPWNTKIDDGCECVIVYFPFDVWTFREVK